MRHLGWQRIVVVACVAVASLFGCAQGTDKGKDKGATTRSSATAAGSVESASGFEPYLKALGGDAKCPSTSDPFRHWCLASEGWASGTAAPLTGPKYYLGLGVQVVEGKPTNWDTTDLVALGIRTDGSATYGKIFSLKAENQKEQMESATAVFNLSKLMRGMSSSAEVPAGLFDDVAGLPPKATNLMTRQAHGWSMAGKSPTELRQAGKYLIAVERVDPKTVWVNVLTDQLTRK